jgi:hypothetical protein
VVRPMIPAPTMTTSASRGNGVPGVPTSSR